MGKQSFFCLEAFFKLDGFLMTLSLRHRAMPLKRRLYGYFFHNPGKLSLESGIKMLLIKMVTCMEISCQEGKVVSERSSLEYVRKWYRALNSLWRNTKISLMRKVSQAFPWRAIPYTIHSPHAMSTFLTLCVKLIAMQG